MPSALGIKPLAFALEVSVEPSFVPDFIFFFKAARDGASVRIFFLAVSLSLALSFSLGEKSVRFASQQLCHDY